MKFYDLDMNDLEDVRTCLGGCPEQVCVQVLEKLNGCNCQISFWPPLDTWVIASKNVSLLARTEADLDLYSYRTHQASPDRFRVAKELGRLWFSLLPSLDSDSLRKALPGLTFVGEAQVDEQHLVEDSHPLVIFAAVINDSGRVMAETDTKDLVERLGLRFARMQTAVESQGWSLSAAAQQGNVLTWDQTVAFLQWVADELPISMSGEGVVVYLSSSSRHCLLKVKTVSYRFWRKVRETLKHQTSSEAADALGTAEDKEWTRYQQRLQPFLNGVDSSDMELARQAYLLVRLALTCQVTPQAVVDYARNIGAANLHRVPHQWQGFIDFFFLDFRRLVRALPNARSLPLLQMTSNQGIVVLCPPFWHTEYLRSRISDSVHVDMTKGMLPSLSMSHSGVEFPWRRATSRPPVACVHTCELALKLLGLLELPQSDVLGEASLAALSVPSTAPGKRHSRKRQRTTSSDYQLLRLDYTEEDCSMAVTAMVSRVLRNPDACPKCSDSQLALRRLQGATPISVEAFKAQTLEATATHQALRVIAKCGCAYSLSLQDFLPTEESRQLFVQLFSSSQQRLSLSIQTISKISDSSLSMPPAKRARLIVLVPTGFPGSGKTTLMSGLLDPSVTHSLTGFEALNVVYLSSDFMTEELIRQESKPVTRNTVMSCIRKARDRFQTELQTATQQAVGPTLLILDKNHPPDSWPALRQNLQSWLPSEMQLQLVSVRIPAMKNGRLPVHAIADGLTRFVQRSQSKVSGMLTDALEDLHVALGFVRLCLRQNVDKETRIFDRFVEFTPATSLKKPEFYALVSQLMEQSDSTPPFKPLSSAAKDTGKRLIEAVKAIPEDSSWCQVDKKRFSSLIHQSIRRRAPPFTYMSVTIPPTSLVTLTILESTLLSTAAQDFVPGGVISPTTLPTTPVAELWRTFPETFSLRKLRAPKDIHVTTLYKGPKRQLSSQDEEYWLRRQVRRNRIHNAEPLGASDRD
ncbi:MAG: hypothetical protein KVP17_004302 [Porospora cf. gigantea B]|uniref:uncharacterized protein n=1 Tax=Porospora cf. gigantea B TaxID=2853592 RepID=UPI003571C683|nr:MAG: hypothetical protein KVP17_004302 [Porospora cf. gigantea B]